MNPLQAISVLALGLFGVATVVSCAPRLRRPGLSARLDAYLGSLAPRRSGLLSAAPVGRGVHAALRPMAEELGRRLHRLLGDERHDLADRLVAAGQNPEPSSFRAEQVTWALAGFGAAVAGVLTMAAAGRTVSPVAALGAAIAFAVGAGLARDQALTRAIEHRRAAVLAEFPTFVDLVCLTVTAGESLRGGLELVATAGDGPLATEMRVVLREARAGRPLADALEAAGARLGVAAFSRFVSSVVAAQERGVPLADSLRAMAFDVREGHKRTVIESAGRKQISMLVPVVALILPVAIVFTLPGKGNKSPAAAPCCS